MSTPIVSVIIPTYNRGDTIERAIDSVLKQSFKQFELIVVDDGSTDNTAKLLDSYSASRLKYIKFDINRGANTARNVGIRESNGSYISFLDSDDEFLPDHLETVINSLEEQPDSVGGVYTSQSRFQCGDLIGNNIAYQSLTSPRDVIERYPASGFSTLTFRRGIFDTVGPLDEDLPAFQDRDFLLRFLRSFDLHPISDILVKYYVHDEQISSNPAKKLYSIDVFMQKHKSIINKYNQSEFAYNKGFLYVKMENMSDARAHFADALRQKPTKGRYFLALLSSYFGYSGFQHIQDYKRSVKRYIDKLILRLNE